MTMHCSEYPGQELPFTMAGGSGLKANNNNEENRSQNDDEVDRNDNIEETSDEEETESVEARRKISILLERFDKGPFTGAMTSPEEFERAQRENQANYVVDMARGRAARYNVSLRAKVIQSKAAAIAAETAASAAEASSNKKSANKKESDNNRRNSKRSSVSTTKSKERRRTPSPTKPKGGNARRYDLSEYGVLSASSNLGSNTFHVSRASVVSTHHELNTMLSDVLDNNRRPNKTSRPMSLNAPIANTVSFQDQQPSNSQTETGTPARATSLPKPMRHKRNRSPIPGVRMRLGSRGGGKPAGRAGRAIKVRNPKYERDAARIAAASKAGLTIAQPRVSFTDAGLTPIRTPKYTTRRSETFFTRLRPRGSSYGIGLRNASGSKQMIPKNGLNGKKKNKNKNKNKKKGAGGNKYDSSKGGRIGNSAKSGRTGSKSKGSNKNRNKLSTNDKRRASNKPRRPTTKNPRMLDSFSIMPHTGDEGDEHGKNPSKLHEDFEHGESDASSSESDKKNTERVMSAIIDEDYATSFASDHAGKSSAHTPSNNKSVVFSDEGVSSVPSASSSSRRMSHPNLHKVSDYGVLNHHAQAPSNGVQLFVMDAVAEALRNSDENALNKAVLADFFKEHAPHRVPDVNELLKRYKGREADLFELLASKVDGTNVDELLFALHSPSFEMRESFEHDLSAIGRGETPSNSLDIDGTQPEETTSKGLLEKRANASFVSQVTDSSMVPVPKRKNIGKKPSQGVMHKGSSSRSDMQRHRGQSSASPRMIVKKVSIFAPRRLSKRDAAIIGSDSVEKSGFLKTNGSLVYLDSAAVDDEAADQDLAAQFASGQDADDGEEEETENLPVLGNNGGLKNKRSSKWFGLFRNNKKQQGTTAPVAEKAKRASKLTDKKFERLGSAWVSAGDQPSSNGPLSGTDNMDSKASSEPAELGRAGRFLFGGKNGSDNNSKVPRRTWTQRFGLAPGRTVGIGQHKESTETDTADEGAQQEVEENTDEDANAVTVDDNGYIVRKKSRYQWKTFRGKLGRGHPDLQEESEDDDDEQGEYDRDSKPPPPFEVGPFVVQPVNVTAGAVGVGTSKARDPQGKVGTGDMNDDGLSMSGLDIDRTHGFIVSGHRLSGATKWTVNGLIKQRMLDAGVGQEEVMAAMVTSSEML